MSWFTTFDDQFWILLAGMILGFLGVIAKSKCSRIACCGLEIERDVQAELAAERMAIAANRNGSSRNPSSGSSLSGVGLSPTPMMSRHVSYETTESVPPIIHLSKTRRMSDLDLQEIDVSKSVNV